MSSLNCTWDDYGTPKDTDLLWVVIQQAGTGIRTAMSADQWALISSAIDKMQTFSVKMHANRRCSGVIFVVVPTRGGLHVEVNAIPRVKATGLQMVDGVDARSKPRPEIRILEDN